MALRMKAPNDRRQFYKYPETKLFFKGFSQKQIFLQKFVSNYGYECGLIEDLMLTAAVK